MIPSSVHIHSVLKNSLTWNTEEKKEAVNIAKHPAPNSQPFPLKKKKQTKKTHTLQL